jgi:putative membrane protein
LTDIVFRLLKGILIGAGFILPGVSGAALAIIFGLYQRIISFIANITKDFISNILYFLPIGIGGCLGIFLVSYPLDFLFVNYEPYLIWGFIGCVIGILPKLWRDAKRDGSSIKHVIIIISTAVLSFVLLYLLKNISGTESETVADYSIFTWLFAGFIISLTALIPGLSSANILIYLGLMKGLLEGIKSLDIMILVPLVFGAVLCVYPLSKLIEYLFKAAYKITYHVIIGIIIASTLIIIPDEFNYVSLKSIICVIAMITGICIGWGMRLLEEKYSNSMRH